MPTLNGDWFHSRSSSNVSELETVRLLVLESRRPEYSGMRWSAGRIRFDGEAIIENDLLYQFSNTVGVEPSTMQTKISSMQRYGFIKEGQACPILWTRMGNLWNELYTVRNFNVAQQVYQLALTFSLSIFAFNERNYCENPTNCELPLKFLLNNLDNQNSVSLDNFRLWVDGNTQRVGSNYSYWKKDLINSGIFRETGDRLIYTGIYPELINEIRNFFPNPMLTDEDWKTIRHDPLSENSPFRDSILSIFEEITNGQNIQEPEELIEPIDNVIVDVIDDQIQQIDILDNDLRFRQQNVRVRNGLWSKRIKELYDSKCVVPNCDINYKLFVESAHIKNDSVINDNNQTPHRTHILNGICLCKICHKAFDKGYFSLDNQFRIIIKDEKFNDMVEQRAKTIITSSRDYQIKSRRDNRFPLIEFIQFHRRKWGFE